jgi:TonB family protein
MPQLLSRIEPDYPAEARALERAGPFSAVLLVGSEGSAQDIRISRGAGFGMDEQAVTAVSKWQFEPAKNHDVAVSTQGPGSDNLPKARLGIPERSAHVHPASCRKAA